MKGQLAQLVGQLEKLLLNGIDAVLVAELRSGQEVGNDPMPREIR